MGTDQAAAHFGGGGGGGRPQTSFHSGGSPFGGGGGGVHMSDADAQAFFSQFFGHSDPFGGMQGGGGKPRMTTSFSSRPGGDMMFGGGMPGGMGMTPMGGSFGGGNSTPFGAFPQQQRPAPKRYDAIPVGTVVSLKGLVSQPERNGDRGQIADYDASYGRYTVALEDSDESLRVKPSNLLQHIHVKLDGIESQPNLNGQQGTIIAWDPHKERYNIYVMNLSKIVSMKPTNVILENGTVAVITGLSAKPELNGKFGTVKAWIQETNRYDVQLSAGQVVRVKVENVRV